MPAICASKYVLEFNALRERIKDRTKISMKAQVAVQRKLLILLHTLWKTGWPYEKGRDQMVHQ